MADAVLAPIVTSPSPRRVLFVRVGWMTRYAGPQSGDERPQGGGGYTKKHIGHELFNFADFNGRLYGIARAKDGRVKLGRIDPAAAAADKLDDVLVIFVARQRIIGWYRGATVHAKTAQLPALVAKQMISRLKDAGITGFDLEGYRFEVPFETAALLPTHERKRRIPGSVKGGFGQSNICYPYHTSGRPKNARWIHAAVAYVLNYKKANLLTAPYEEAISDEAAAVAQEQAAGFQSNSQIRSLIEEHAMRKARTALESCGYRNFNRTSAFRPYDYTCEKSGTQFFVEVKGTQTPGRTVILTRHEVDHVNAHPDTSILVLVHSIGMVGTKAAKGGAVEVKEQWRLRAEDLTAIQYVWVTNQP